MRPSGDFYKTCSPDKVTLWSSPTPPQPSGIGPDSVSSCKKWEQMESNHQDEILQIRSGPADTPKTHFPNMPRLSVKPNLVLPARLELATSAM